MYIANNYTDKFLDKTNQKFSESGVGGWIDSKLINNYKELLQTIANKSKYQEGAKILTEDLAQINQQVKAILDDMKNGMAEKRVELSPKARAQYDAFSSMVQVSDHLFAMAMKTLGSPDMPESFGSEVTDHIAATAIQAEFLIKEQDYKKATTERHYRDQRRRDADFVRKANAQTKQFILEKTASPIRVATYAAEYQALKRRQEGHGAIWRYFHQKENAARTKLLEEMKNLLISTVGNDIDLDSSTPFEIAEAYNKPILNRLAEEAFKEDAVAKRNQIPDNYFKREAKSNELSGEKREQMNPSLLSADVNGKDVNQKSEQIDETKASAKEIDNASDKQSTYERYLKLTSDPELFETEIFGDICKIIGRPNTSEEDKRGWMELKVYPFVTSELEDLCKTFDDAKSKGADQAALAGIIEEGANKIYECSYDALGYFGELADDQQKDFNARQKTIGAQMITDVFLNKLSPVAFEAGRFGDLGKNLVIRNRDHALKVIQQNEPNLNEAQCIQCVDHAAKKLHAFEPVKFDKKEFNNASKNTEAPKVQINDPAKSKSPSV